MSTDPQTYYANAASGSHPQATNYYVTNTAIDPQYQMSMRNPAPYGAPRMTPQFVNQQIANGYQPYYPPAAGFLPPPFLSPHNTRPANPQYYHIIRSQQPIDNMNAAQNFMPQPGYAPYGQGNAAISTTSPVFQGQPFFPPNFQMPQYPQQIPQTQQTIPQQQQQYSMGSTLPPPPPPQQQQPPPQQILSTQAAQHPSIEQQHIPSSQSTLTSNPAQINTYQPPAPSLPRKRMPLEIKDPTTLKPLEISTATTATTTTTTTPSLSSSTVTNDTRSVDSTTTTTDSAALNTKPTDDTTKTQIRTDFRHQMAKLFEPSNAPSEKHSSQPSANDDPPGAAPTKQPSQKQLESVAPQSTSRPKSPTPTPSTNVSSKESTSSKSSDQPQPSFAVPGIRTRNITDDKLNTKTHPDDVKDTRDSKHQQESEPIDSNEKVPFEDPKNKTDEDTNPDSHARAPLSSSTSLECVTPPQTPTPLINNDKTPVAAPNQRLRYDRHELLRIRDSSGAFPVPNLPDLDIVMKGRDNHRLAYQYTGTNSQGRSNQQVQRQLSLSNHPSLSRFPNNQSAGSSNDSRRKAPIYLASEPDFGNRVENPYKPVDQTKIDTNNKVLRDVKSILNKVTPTTFEKLQKQLEGLEIDRYERLEGMINIFFFKAVEEPAFSFLYAKLCKQFQKKQVTVPSDDGKTVTHYFRQILLTRCQKEFENDYRQEIEYERRNGEVEAIQDEKKRKEEKEKLEEDLVKAKRKKLGNIFFIGELFKLQMLTDTIMYDCIEYLLRDKTDEESLECLCRLLRTIGKELDIKACEKAANKTNLERHYRDLYNIIKEMKMSARIRFMIQDLMELRQANWVARRTEAKPTTIDEIHEQERLKREQQERDQERDRQQRRDQNRGTVIGSGYNQGNQQQYNDSRGSRGSGIKQQASRNDEDRVENRFSVNSLRQLQSNDKRNLGSIAMSLAPQRTWAKGSGVEKKPEDDRSVAARGTGKPPAGPVQQLKGKVGSSQGGPAYTLQRQSSRELARENSHRDRENALQSLRKTTTTTGSGINSPISAGGSSSMANSREGSRNVSREQSRNASRESSVSERTSNVGLSTQTSKTSTGESTAVINQDPSNTSFDEEKTQARVHSLIEEYTENYSDSIDRPVKEALEDLSAFCTSSPDQQALIVRGLFTNVLEAKARARKAVGHLLDAALSEEILTAEAFLAGFKMIVEAAPDYAVDIPLIWQYIGEIVGALIGAPTSNMFLLKPVLQSVPEDKSKQLFQYIIRYATEFSSQSRVQRFWHSSGFSLNDLLKSDLVDDSSLRSEYDWLSDTPENDPSTPQSRENLSPRADSQLVKLFKSVSDQATTVTDPVIIAYIREHMDPNEKFYIRNIVLSYLEACLINRDPQKKIQDDIAKKRMTILNAIIEHKPEAEIQAVYAIQNFVNKLEHPPKMARLLFDIFYDEECVSEDAFFEWLKHPDQSETEGHAVVEMSTKDFFTWLQQAETEVEEGEEEEGGI